MKEVQFRKSEVISYLEDKLLDGIANDDEEELYSNFKWTGKINRNTYVWKNLIIEMRDIYENGYK